MSAAESLRRPVFWNFGGLYFFYFGIWALTFTFLPIWLKNEGGMGPAAIGMVNTVMAVTALVLQPLYGYLQDRLGFRKHLFSVVVVCAALMGPFFGFVFLPLIDVNQYLAAAVGGIYLSLALNSGVGVVEAFNERNSRAHRFEYGHARLFGSLAGGTANLVGGILWAANPDSVWWAGSCSALLLGTLLLLARTPVPEEAPAEETEPGARRISKEAVGHLLRDRSFLGFVLLMFGTAALYDVFDQQFPNYFAQFVTSGDANVLFSRVVAVQVFLEAGVMVFTPWFVNRVGARKGLLLFATILVVRILGAALFTHTALLVVWRLLASFEMPLMLVSVMKYLTRMFDVRISATAYMLGFNFAKQIGVALFSTVFGAAYAAIGFSQAYVWMAVTVAVLTVVASFLMRDDRERPVTVAPEPEPAGARA
ncbi:MULTISPECIES: oligosaccharide MFS transporter [unclassified Streptomyces]|uniref:oligosaccharide MFS transporter n=1 Tax=unclassified Streptomyces TaxID=2593676 RepID=UPI00278C83B2|nr:MULTISPECIES: oligosaccharide MFS transporter [unclassified Streptomyces]